MTEVSGGRNDQNGALSITPRTLHGSEGRSGRDRARGCLVVRSLVFAGCVGRGIDSLLLEAGASAGFLIRAIKMAPYFKSISSRAAGPRRRSVRAFFARMGTGQLVGARVPLEDLR